MAGFLRKKSKAQPSPSSSTAEQPHHAVLKKPATAPSTAPPPLFARFATGGSGTSGGGGDAGGGGRVSVVSGPMALSGTRGGVRRGNSQQQQYPEQYPQQYPQQQQRQRRPSVDKPLPIPVPAKDEFYQEQRGRMGMGVSAPSSYTPPVQQGNGYPQRPPSAQGYQQQRPPSSQGNHHPQQQQRPPSSQGFHPPQRPPSSQGTYQHGNAYPQRPPSASASSSGYPTPTSPPSQRPPSAQGYFPPPQSIPPSSPHSPQRTQQARSPPATPSKSPPTPSKAPAVPAKRVSILRDPNPPPNLALFESSKGREKGKQEGRGPPPPSAFQSVPQQQQQQQQRSPSSYQSQPLPPSPQQQQQRPPSSYHPQVQQQQQQPPSRSSAQNGVRPGSVYQGQQQGQQGQGQGQGQGGRDTKYFNTGSEMGELDAGFLDEALLFQEYSQTIPTPPNSLGINSRQSQPLPVEKDNNNNKGTPGGSSGNLGKEEYAAPRSVLATSTPLDTPEMGGAFSRMTKRSPELQRAEASSSASSSAQQQQQQPRQMIQQTGGRGRQPVVVPPHAPAPITNYSVPLRAPVAVASRASPLVNANTNANNVIRKPAYAPVEVEPGFPTPSPPPSIPLPSTTSSVSSPPPPTFPPDFSRSGAASSDPPYSTFSPSPPTKSPSMRLVNMPMTTRGKPLIFAAMAKVEGEPQVQRPQERRTNGITSPNMQGRMLPQEQKQQQRGAAQTSPPVEFASPKKQPNTLNDAETMLKNRPISLISSSPPKVSGPRAIPPSSKTRTPSPPAAPNSPSQSASSPRMHGPRQLPPQNPRVRKLSKARGGGNVADINGNGSSEAVGAGPPSSSSVSISRIPPKGATSSAVDPSSPHVDEETARKAGIPLDDDPFAKAEGVKMLPPSSPPPSRDGHSTPAKKSRKKDGSVDDSRSVRTYESRPSTANREHAPSIESETHPGEIKESKESKEVIGGKTATTSTPSGSPDDIRSTRKLRVKAEKLAATASATQPQSDLPFPKDKSEDRSPSRMGHFSLTQFLADPHLLSTLLSFLSFHEWLVVSSVSREIRIMLVQTAPLREEVLERYLRTVGYTRWGWDGAEPLSLSLQDLADYMRGVSTPTHEYARIAAMYVQSLGVHPNLRDPEVDDIVRCYTAATRSYTRVVLRLRAQAEREQLALQQRGNTTPNGRSMSLVRNGYPSPSRIGASRASSRAPSPTQSSFSHGANTMSPGGVQQAQSQGRGFQSPLFRLRRAPLLRVFVPSPEGDWLSDKSVVECEAECKRAGVQHLLRTGDVVWDVAVGDEGNVGRLVWDGSYLIDLDYTYTSSGDLPKYLPALAFPPSYFHRVIRTGAVASNPIVHIDISPWGEEVAANLQLLQDRVRTETPQGAIHNVVRWVHRSSFVIRLPPPRPRHPPYRIPIPDTEMFVDSGWFGTIVVETEGTNEALADLQDRCGPRAFPPRVRPVAGRQGQAQIEARKVWRIIREKSRPGEIWIRAVTAKERLLPPPVN